MLSGLFFGYSVSVSPGLKRLKDSEYVRAMQSINIVIQNPIFFLSFMGPLILLPLVTWLTWGDDPTQSWLLLSASVVYFVGPFGITAGGNVPLNEKLALAQEKDYSAARAAFEKHWNRLHTIRTFGGVVATVLVFAACLQ